jgi:uncharacterized protein (TIGR02391 family)
MFRRLDKFEAIARAAGSRQRQDVTVVPAPLKITASTGAPIVEIQAPPHPFDSRNIHPDLPPKVRQLFDDGHYPEATSHAFKFLEKKVQKHSGITSKSGEPLMMEAFDGNTIKLNALITISEKDEQAGYRFIFAGGTRGIRNPRAHEPSILDDPDICLDHLSLVSLLLRRLEQAGYK